MNVELGLAFLLYLLPALIAVLLAPVTLYRAYALWGAYYILERDGIRLRWGLRSETIPMNTVLWVRQDNELPAVPVPPKLRWPGAVTGQRVNKDIGTVEYMATRARHLTLIATPERVFAISPLDPQEFQRTYQHLTELGSLTPFASSSVYPTFLLARIWRDPLARILIISGLALNLLLLIWVSLIAPARPQILLGFAPGGQPVPAIRLFLLPILSSFFFFLDLFLGIFFFRRVGAAKPATRDIAHQQPGTDHLSPLPESSETRPSVERTPDNTPLLFTTASPLVPEEILAYLLWGSGILSALLFLLAIFLILRAGV